MGFYSDFIQYCRMCGREMQVAVDGGTGLHPGNDRDAVCSEPCRREFQQRQDRSSANTTQDLAVQRGWRVEEDGQHVSALASGHSPPR
jgi:hypothetical protein